MIKLKDILTEVEQLLLEKLIIYGNRAPYGQVLFMAGGAGSQYSVPFKDQDGKPIMVQPNDRNKWEKARSIIKDFVYLPVKKQGGGFYPESTWKSQLFNLIKQNAPKTTTNVLFQ